MVCSNWTSPELGLLKCHDGPRKVALSVERLGHHQKLMTSRKDRTAVNYRQSMCSQLEYRPGGRVCLPLTPKTQEVRAKTHV